VLKGVNFQQTTNVPTTSDSEIILRDGRIVQRTTTIQDLGSQDEVFASLSPQEPKFLPGMANLATDPGCVQPMHMLIYPDRTLGPKHLMAFAEVDSIPFNTNFTLDANGEQRFSFSTDYVNNLLVRRSLRWSADAIKIHIDPKAKILLGFIGCPDSNSNGQTTWHLYRGQLMLMMNNMVYALPYPNVYESGQICLGANHEVEYNTLPLNQKSTLTEFWKSNRQLFEESAMNKDLTTTQSPRFFAFDKNDKPVNNEALANWQADYLSKYRLISDALIIGIEPKLL
jgi:hypothetical protein